MGEPTRYSYKAGYVHLSPDEHGAWITWADCKTLAERLEKVEAAHRKCHVDDYSVIDVLIKERDDLAERLAKQEQDCARFAYEAGQLHAEALKKLAKVEKERAEILESLENAKTTVLMQVERYQAQLKDEEALEERLADTQRRNGANIEKLEKAEERLATAENTILEISKLGLELKASLAQDKERLATADGLVKAITATAKYFKEQTEKAEAVCRAYQEYAEADTNANWRQRQALGVVFAAWRKERGGRSVMDSSTRTAFETVALGGVKGASNTDVAVCVIALELERIADHLGMLAELVEVAKKEADSRVS